MQKLYHIKGVEAERAVGEIMDIASRFTDILKIIEVAYNGYPSGKQDITRRLTTIHEELERVHRRVQNDVAYRGR